MVWRWNGCNSSFKDLKEKEILHNNLKKVCKRIKKTIKNIKSGVMNIFTYRIEEARALGVYFLTTKKKIGLKF